MKSFLENLNKYFATPLIAIVAAVYGLYIDSINKKLQSDGIKIENINKALEGELRQKEFDKDLKFQLFGEVKAALVSQNPGQQKIVAVFITEMLADDSVLRENFRNILLNSGGTDASVKEAIIEDRKSEVEFFNPIAVKTAKTGKLRVDIFYLEETQKISKSLADSVARKFPEDDYVVNVRKLPTSVNSKRGYSISANEIRCEAVESEEAERVLAIVNGSNILKFEPARKKVIAYRTPNYISVFIRNK